MYQLIGKDRAGNPVVLDDKIPDEFATQHDAEYCGQYYPDYTDFELQAINDNLITLKEPDIG